MLMGKQPQIHTAHIPIFKSPSKCSNVEHSVKCRLDVLASYSWQDILRSSNNYPVEWMHIYF